MAEAGYEQAEAAYLAGIRADMDRLTMTGLAALLAARAEEWNAAAYQAFLAAGKPERNDLDWLTERTEVLSELWADVRSAYAGDGPQ